MRATFFPRVVLTLCVLALAAPPSSGAGEARKQYRLTLSAARELARTRAPALLAARARSDVARGERLDVSVWQPTDPELALSAGPRRMDGDKVGTDFEIAIGQRFELGGRRDARIERADAAIARADATTDDAERELLRSVSASFLITLHAERSLELARESERLFEETRRVAELRYEAGDAGILDPYAASLAHARSRARSAEVEATRILAARQLRALLGLEPDAEVVVEGELERSPRPALESLETLLARAAERPDLKAIEARIAETLAEQRLARGLRAPELGAFVSYGEEEDSEIVMGGLSLSLPFLDRGRGQLAIAEAEQRALGFDLQATQAAAGSDVHAWYDAFSLLNSAASRFESDELPRLQEMLKLARTSYESGNIPFAELLVLQRESVETRQAFLDLLLQAALVNIELEAAAGVL